MKNVNNLVDTDTRLARFSSFKDFYESTDLADLRVTCGNLRWRVHKFVVSAHSSFFRKACTGSFKEAQESVIELQEDDEQAVGAMIYYMYHGHLTECKSSTIDIETNLLLLRLYTLADKYDVAGLCVAVRNDFNDQENFGDEEAVAAMVKEIYSSPVLLPVFREELCRLVSWHLYAEDLFSPDADDKALGEALCGQGKFAVGLLKYMHSNALVRFSGVGHCLPDDTWPVQCQNCHNQYIVHAMGHNPNCAECGGELLDMESARRQRG